MSITPEGSVLNRAQIAERYGSSVELFRAAVKDLMVQTYRAHGLLVTVTDTEGKSQEILELDTTQARNRLLALFKERHVVATASALYKSAVTQRELFRELFPDGPGASKPPGDAVEEAAYKAMCQWAWNQVSSSPASSAIQELLEQEGQTLVVCQTKVRRVGKQAGEEAGVKTVRFLSDSGPVILKYGIGGLGTVLAKTADKVEKVASRVRGLHPELALKIVAELESYVQQVKAAIPSANASLVKQLMAEQSPYPGADSGATAA